ncbi:Crp/Fnr family transcriptional regulator [Zavarzinella formosa]|uniref:Crp/Fnr family transcriptional regulator n=1 Tax=Zavarzinella formosa TaxID=360055 RepID=UPI0003694113|nr:Crp/Fnr family transcriptional regulator [Zavarzinella formosa]
MRTVELRHGQVLHHAGHSITEVYFPLDCMISITVTVSAGRTAEAGAVGSREMVGINAFMGGRETNHTEYVAQIAGSAIIMPAGPLLEEFDTVKPVRDVLLRYTQAYIAHLSQNVACNRLHQIDQRLARWLMECRDRLRSDDLAITHEFLAEMLGVRRAGVSETAGRLQDRGLIRIGRKRVRILDSKGLEAASCECYRLLRDEYDRLLGPMRPGGPGTTS